MHCVGSIPHNGEIDVPLNYADYYFLEALKRKRDIEQKLRFQPYPPEWDRSLGPDRHYIDADQ